jgi:hypothetical protein
VAQIPKLSKRIEMYYIHVGNPYLNYFILLNAVKSIRKIGKEQDFPQNCAIKKLVWCSRIRCSNLQGNKVGVVMEVADNRPK